MELKAGKPDPRVLIIQVLIATTLGFSLGRQNELVMLFLVTDCLYLLQCEEKRSVKYLGFYLVLVIGYQLLIHIYIPVISPSYIMMFTLYQRLFPAYVACIILFESTVVNELITVLRKCFLPIKLVIPMVVVYRYIPTIRDEVAHIRESMKMRNIHLSILHPVQIIENFMIPLLIRSGKIADELSASAVCKGLDDETKRTSAVNVYLNVADWGYLLFSIVEIVVCMLIHYYNLLSI